MTTTSLQEFAKSIGISQQKLKEQLEHAGMKVLENQITQAQQEALYDFLKKHHTQQADQKEFSRLVKTKKITLKRKSHSEIKITRSTGQKSTIPVVRKRRRTYVKKELSEETILTPNSPIESATQTPAPVAQQALGGKGAVEVRSVEPEREQAASDSENLSKKEKEKEKEKATKKKDKKKAKPPKSKEETLKRKKPLIKNLNGANEEIENLRSRRRQKVKNKPNEESVLINRQAFEKPVEAQIYEVKIPETTTVSELAEAMSVKAAVVIKELMKIGVMVTINQPIDQDTAILVVEEMGHKPAALKQASVEDALKVEYGEGEIKPRAPVVTVMGHVDHGKTSLLDYIRRTSVTKGEAGGITQHIGAYHVVAKRGDMTFLDTPGHAAFTSMRARGAQCTDVVILVVAADDGVMPQTLEAIQHAKAANVPIVVAINKIDKPQADVERIQNALSQHGLIPEAWGGQTMFIPVSAKEGTGIEALLDAVLLQAEILELKAAVLGPAKGVVVEARVDKGRGPVASLLVQSGQLQAGDTILAGLHYGRVRAMTNDLGEKVKLAGPAIPVEVLGLSGAPNAGEDFVVVVDERKAREVALFRQGKYREVKLARQQSTKLDGFLERLDKSDHKTLNLVIKTDVQGSAEALTDALQELSNEEVKVNVVANGAGSINESDVNLALASNAVLIGFNVRADAQAKRVAQSEKVDLNYFSVIYEVLDNVKRAITGLKGPIIKEEIVGIATVKEVFRSSKIGSIAGCMVTEGTVKRALPIRVLRDNVVIFEGELESLRRFKDEAKEVKSGTECGIGVKNYNDVKIGDQIEVYEKKEIRPSFDPSTD